MRILEVSPRMAVMTVYSALELATFPGERVREDWPIPDFQAASTDIKVHSPTKNQVCLQFSGFVPERPSVT